MRYYLASLAVVFSGILALSALGNAYPDVMETAAYISACIIIGIVVLFAVVMIAEFLRETYEPTLPRPYTTNRHNRGEDNTLEEDIFP